MEENRALPCPKRSSQIFLLAGLFGLEAAGGLFRDVHMLCGEVRIVAERHAGDGAGSHGGTF